MDNCFKMCVFSIGVYDLRCRVKHWSMFTTDLVFSVAERAQRAANRKKHLQIKKTTSWIWQHTHCKYSQHNQTKKYAANKILYLVVLWAFAAAGACSIKQVYQISSLFQLVWLILNQINWQ